MWLSILGAVAVKPWLSALHGVELEERRAWGLPLPGSCMGSPGLASRSQADVLAVGRSPHDACTHRTGPQIELGRSRPAVVSENSPKPPLGLACSRLETIWDSG